MSEKPHDIVVFGATSFVGRILCRYLLERHGAEGPLRWAMAGRSQKRLEQLRADLGESARALPLIIADAGDREALTRMCDAAKVVVSTVGPYALYGSTLVEVCARTGTDYCDLTGETQWIRRMIDAHSASAQQSGARIVHSCGFDSIPSDLGVLFHQQRMIERHGEPAKRIRMRVKAMRGGLSGGTVASMMNTARELAADPSLRRALQDPYILVDGERPKTRQPNVSAPVYDEAAKSWVAPFVMAGINTRIVQRSHALMGYPWGQDFQYDEAVMTGDGLSGRLRALGAAAGIAAFFTAAAIKPTRALLERFVVPKPGEGPSEEAQRRGFFDLRFYGKTASGKTLVTRVTGDRDPGYGSTAKMLGEAAACLACDVGDRVGGGFWTSATIFGDDLIRRLEQHAGLRFELVDG